MTFKNFAESALEAHRSLVTLQLEAFDAMQKNMVRAFEMTRFNAELARDLQQNLGQKMVDTFAVAK